MDKNKRENATGLNDEMLDGVSGGVVDVNQGKNFVPKSFCRDCNMVVVTEKVNGKSHCTECGGNNLRIPGPGDYWPS